MKALFITNDDVSSNTKCVKPYLQNAIAKIGKIIITN